MALGWLVVSDPPHREIDLPRAAQLLGLTPAEVRMKANFGAPEIWLAYGSEAEAEEAVASLGEAGLSVEVLDGHVLSRVPGPAPVTSFTLAEDRLVARIRDEEIVLAYDAPTLAVFCKPPAGFRPMSSSAQVAPQESRRTSSIEVVKGMTRAGRDRGRLDPAEALELMTTLDLYAPVGGRLARVSVGRDLADFSSLGGLMQLSGDANMAVFLSECERLFTKLTVDRRHENVRPRQRPQVSAAPDREARRLFAFGLMRLSRLLESIEPGLAHLTNYELGSRLSLFLNRTAVGAG